MESEGQSFYAVICFIKVPNFLQIQEFSLQLKLRFLDVGLRLLSVIGA